VSPLAAALFEALGEAELRELALRLEPFLTPVVGKTDEWMDSRAAAEYLGFPSVHVLHKLTSARTIPFHQDGPGCKCWFKRSELDAWRAS
jgi:hypothetical protein